MDVISWIKTEGKGSRRFWGAWQEVVRSGHSRGQHRGTVTEGGAFSRAFYFSMFSMRNKVRQNLLPLPLSAAPVWGRSCWGGGRGILLGCQDQGHYMGGSEGQFITFIVLLPGLGTACSILIMFVGNRQH